MNTPASQTPSSPTADETQQQQRDIQQQQDQKDAAKSSGDTQPSQKAAPGPGRDGPGERYGGSGEAPVWGWAETSPRLLAGLGFPRSHQSGVLRIGLSDVGVDDGADGFDVGDHEVVAAFLKQPPPLEIADGV